MCNNKIEISRMTVSDLYSIKDSLISDFDDFWSFITLETELNDEHSYYIVAKNVNKINNAHCSEIVGFAGMKIIIDEADIMNIVTKKNKRNLGIASLMLKKLIYIAREKNVQKLTLEVNYKNLAAIHLYEKFNFKKIAVRKKYYRNIDDAIIMLYRKRFIMCVINDTKCYV